MTDERCTEQRRDGSLLNECAYAAIELFELTADSRQLLACLLLQLLWFDEVLKLSCHRYACHSLEVDQVE
jgi:hypothetical protein